MRISGNFFCKARTCQVQRLNVGTGMNTHRNGLAEVFHFAAGTSSFLCNRSSPLLSLFQTKRKQEIGQQVVIDVSAKEKSIKFIEISPYSFDTF